jgi:hypothetical protein
MLMHWGILTTVGLACGASVGLGVWTAFAEPRRQVLFKARFLRSVQQGLKLRAPVVESFFQEVDALIDANGVRALPCERIFCAELDSAG